jgi:nucleotide-binding universal stress UspA family protein
MECGVHGARLAFAARSSSLRISRSKEVDVLLHAPEQQHHHAPEPTVPVASAGASRTVLVGVDGSDESRAAFMAAMARAGPNDTVVVIHAYPPVWGWLGSPYYQRALDDRLNDGERILRELRASPATAQTQVSFEQHEGRPAEVLARIAALRDVDEIVVGARRLGRLRALVDSVSRALLRTTNRPVLVVPHRPSVA